MKLFIDLSKAGETGAGVLPKSGRRAVRDYKDSFDEENSGVMGGYAPDDPDKGPRASHGDPLDDELEEDRKEDAEVAKERGISKTVAKAFKLESMYLVKSLAKSLSDRVIDLRVASPTEEEFLLEKGFGLDEINGGHVYIEGTMRSEFNEWLMHRMNKSVQSLLGGNR